MQLKGLNSGLEEFYSKFPVIEGVNINFEVRLEVGPDDGM